MTKRHRPTRMPPRAPVLVAASLVLAGVAAVAAFVVLSGDGTVPPPRTISFEIPAGAKRRIERGSPLVAIPERISGRVGDQIVVRNRDSAFHFLGGYNVAPGQILRIPLRRAGTIVTDCSLHKDNSVTIIVREP